MFDILHRHSFEDATKRSFFFTILVLSALLSSPAVFATETSDSTTTQQEKTFKVFTPFGEVNLSEEYKTEIFIVFGIIALLYYGPTMFSRLRETFRESKSNARSLEVERMRLENLKIKYEIEALKKTHDLSTLDLDIGSEGDEHVTVIPATKIDTSAKFNTLVRPQLERTDVRQRFIFRRVIAFFIDYFIVAFTFGFITGLVSAFWDIDSLYDDGSLFGIVLILSATLYLAGMWATLGATVGLKIVGLKIISLDGRAITVKATLIRLAVWVVSSVFGFIWLLFDPRKQSLPDKAAKSVVVKVSGRLEQADNGDLLDPHQQPE